MKLHWTDKFRQILNSGTVHRVLLWGEPGTGKSSSIPKMYPDKVFHRVPIHEESAEESLIGTQIDIGKSGIVDGAAILAMERGEALILDEIDKRHPSLDGVLHAVLDDLALAQLKARCGRVVRPAKGFFVVATTNENPSALSEPVLDRFDAILQAESPPAEALLGMQKDSQKVVTNHYGNIKPTPYKRGVTLRRFKAFEALRTPLGKELAAEVVFCDAAKEVLSCLAAASV